FVEVLPADIQHARPNGRHGCRLSGIGVGGNRRPSNEWIRALRAIDRVARNGEQAPTFLQRIFDRVVRKIAQNHERISAALEPWVAIARRDVFVVDVGVEASSLQYERGRARKSAGESVSSQIRQSFDR